MPTSTYFDPSTGSQLEDTTSLTRQLMDDLYAGSYECAVCSDVIPRGSPLWYCTGGCYAVFHLSCMRRWATTMTQQRQQQLSASSQAEDVFRLGKVPCPLCRALLPESSLQQHQCYCGKAVEEPHNDPMRVPGSCGEVCGRRRGPHCPHRCAVLCHPGPCASCPFTREMHCYCGKTQSGAVRCRRVCCSAAEEYFSCGEVCGKLLECGKHPCTLPCHEGPCPSCSVEMKTPCFCGQSHRLQRCGTTTTSARHSSSTSERGTDALPSFSCGQPCAKWRDCGRHRCGVACHPGNCAPCLRQPSRQQCCPCGKTRLANLAFSAGVRERRVCTDPIPTCGLPCELRLSCGHTCWKLCHDDDLVEEEETTPGADDITTAEEENQSGGEPPRTEEGAETSATTGVVTSRSEGTSAAAPLRVEGRKEQPTKKKKKAMLKLFSPSSSEDRLPAAEPHAGDCESPEEKKPRMKTERTTTTRDAPLMRNNAKKHPDGVETAANDAGNTTLSAEVRKIFARCGPCKEMLTYPCRCCREEVPIPCFCLSLEPAVWAAAADITGLHPSVLPASHELPPKCRRPCRALLSCRKHRCTDTCCIDADHICGQICVKKLHCGHHKCAQLCHSGPCASCTQVSYERLYCRCRKTWVEPPVPCGTPVPRCEQPCVHPRPCGHAALHACHSDEVPCPPCVVLVEKTCVSHGTVMPYFMSCSRKDVLCGKKCGKKQTCCGLVCEKPCHVGPCAHRCATAYPSYREALKGNDKGN